MRNAGNPENKGPLMSKFLSLIEPANDLLNNYDISEDMFDDLHNFINTAIRLVIEEAGPAILPNGASLKKL